MGTLRNRGLVAHEATNQRETSLRNELETSLVYEAHVANRKITPPLPRREKAAASRSAHRHWDLAQRTRQLAAVTTSGQAMDPSEMLVKDPYAHVSILRAHLRPELGQQLEAAPSSLESQPLPMGSCTLEPTEEAPGPKGAEAAASIQGQQAWQQPCTPYGSGQSQAGLTYAGLPSMGCGGNTARHRWCCVIS
ncbi:cysteine-rich tail protein 1 [Neophocaena asiaeorientalis asiaeorientalis]|uniref:Cysteine-rich tail protein 1 n=1 Tax=Neophocaena asiaeorientalis asiaeorientalis TaxID=1706337 RepID=A0A341CV02_NEOAA|nr:cysteine-rich tail protein 1 [Neophocaena asiaeorientalis asiaeorientalis]